MKIYTYKISELADIALNILSLFDFLHSDYIDIEFIIESSNINIIPVLNLKRDFSIYAFLSLDFKNIYVDKYIFENNSYIYRFTIAEEFAHLYLHKKAFENLKNLDDVIEYTENLHEDLYKKYERNAKKLASMLLIPKFSLNNHLKKIYLEYEKNIPVHLQTEKLFISYAALKLNDMYKVNSMIVEYRIIDSDISQFYLIQSEYF
ncbi:MAG TPA: ImmA/IrrE family metallo-endopeptidase [bacterium]|nr:ImmA/IrrE family metallo-endopeptidase [bacterium]